MTTASAQKVATDLLRGDGSDTSAFVAATVQGTKSNEQVVALLLDLCQVEEDKRRNRCERLLIYALPLSFYAYLAVAKFYPGSIEVGRFGAAGLAFAVIFGALNQCNAIRQSATRWQVQAALAVCRAAPRDTRSLAMLLDLLPANFVSVPHWREGLKEVFPVCASSLWDAGDDAALALDPSRHKRLRGTLNALWGGSRDLSAGEADFCAAAARALTLTGDLTASRIMRRIATSKRSGEKRAFVSDLAKDCLPLLARRGADRRVTFGKFRALLHAPGKAIDPAALNDLLNTIGPEATQEILRRYVRDMNGRFQLNRIVAKSVVVASLLLAVALWTHPIPAADIHPAFIVFPLVCGTVWLVSSSDPRTGVSKLRFQSVLNHSAGSSSRTLLADILDMLAQKSCRGLNTARVAKTLNALQPGDSVYFKSRHLAFLRDVARKWLTDPEPRECSAELTAGAIYALGIAGDEKAIPLMERYLRDQHHENTPLRAAALNALRRINDAKQWASRWQSGIRGNQWDRVE